MRDGIRQEILNFGDTQLDKFDEPFRYSTLVRLIDNFNTGIVSNLTAISLRKEIVPIVGSIADYTIKFSNPIFHPHVGHIGAIHSTTFGYNNYNTCNLIDNNGTINIISGDTEVVNNIGTIDYDTGVLNLTGFNPQSVGQGGKLSVIAQPRINNVDLTRGQILSIISDDVVITMRQES